MTKWKKKDKKNSHRLFYFFFSTKAEATKFLAWSVFAFFLTFLSSFLYRQPHADRVFKKLFTF